MAGLNDDVLAAVARVLDEQRTANQDLQSFRLVCKQWHRVGRQSMQHVCWKLLSDQATGADVLERTLAAFPNANKVTIRFPAHAALLRPHFHEVLGTLLQGCTQLEHLHIAGPAAVQFSLAPSVAMVEPFRQMPPTSHLRSLSITGQLANSAYREMHIALASMGTHLTRLCISGTHQWTVACDLGQLLDLPTLAPSLEVLEIPLSMGQESQTDSPVDMWALGLRGSLHRLKSLRRLAITSTLYHVLKLAQAIGSLDTLKGLRELQLQVQASLDPLWNIEDPWLDPALGTAAVWADAFSSLTQLTSLSLTTDEVPQELWTCLSQCRWLRRLELQHTGWGLDFDLAERPVRLYSLQELRLCLGDADLSSLCLPSLRTSLTTLHLHLKGLTYGLELPAQSASQHGTGLAVLSHLTALSHFSCEAPSYTLSSNDLSAFAASWLRLESLSWRGASKVASVNFSHWTSLKSLTLLAGGSLSQQSLCLAFFPSSLTSLQLDCSSLTVEDPTEQLGGSRVGAATAASIGLDASAPAPAPAQAASPAVESTADSAAAAVAIPMAVLTAASMAVPASVPAPTALPAPAPTAESALEPATAAVAVPAAVTAAITVAVPVAVSAEAPAAAIAAESAVAKPAGAVPAEAAAAEARTSVESGASAPMVATSTARPATGSVAGSTVGTAAVSAPASTAEASTAEAAPQPTQVLPHLRRLCLQRCAVLAPLQSLLPSCLTSLELRDTHCPGRSMSLSAVAQACPNLVVLRSGGSLLPETSQLGAFKDSSLEALSTRLSKSLRDLELTVGSNVTPEGLQHLERLTSLSTLELTGPAPLLQHSNFGELTQLRSLTMVFKASRLISGLERSTLRAQLPDCYIQQRFD